MSAPRVSIVIPAYNAAAFIPRALGSALGQTYQNIEVIVVDDGSTDSTASIIRGLSDPRLRYIAQPNTGLGRARNRGIEASTGAYVTFLDADDFYLPAKVERQVQFLQAHPQFKVAYCGVLHYFSGRPEVVFRARTPKRSGNLVSQLIWGSYINPNAPMMAREVLERAGPFNESRYYPEDWEMWLKIALAGFEFGYVNEDLVVVEIREDSLTKLETQPALLGNVVRMMSTLLPATIHTNGRSYSTAAAIRLAKRREIVTRLLVDFLPGRAVSKLRRWRQVRRWDVMPGVRVDAVHGRLVGI